MVSVLPSLVALGIAALAALWLARSRPSPAAWSAQRHAAARSFIIAIGIQGVHFVEETVTGFHARLPAVFGLQPIPLGLFIGFNVAWLAVWISCIPGMRTGRAAAFFCAWFLAIAGMLNGVAHPVLAAATAGYFPGLFSAPILGVAGVVLWTRLRAATRPA